MDAGNLTYNQDKNRYQNIKPFDNNRVKLKKLQNRDGSDYVNASWIDTYLTKKRFIASQAPLPSTFGDFWRMIFEKESWTILLLGNEIEDGKVKVDRFWPTKDNIISLGNFSLKLINEQTHPKTDLTIRQIELLNIETGISKLIQFLQYTSWPDIESLDEDVIEKLVNIMHLTLTWENNLKAKCVTLVTSSGIGKSGVMIALCAIEEEAKTEGKVNIFRTVQRLHQQRTALVQTLDEYQLIYYISMDFAHKVRKLSTISIASFSDQLSSGFDILPDGISISEDGHFEFGKQRQYEKMISANGFEFDKLSEEPNDDSYIEISST